MSAIDVLSETELEVRDALPDDVHAIAAIYAWHVLHGRASFEEVPPYHRRNASAYEKRG
ncbi:N-acetyltransferase GCN5 [Enterobacter asburiae]|uniref:N-acetyltransferase GCN5 n=1 Tax=Enterobacter asburiae TaxID=61645 RepID=A0A376FLZ6_ENTAS|nr:N-acetyltransferase GCN5 [Enterobacter asburiae]